MKTQKNPEPLSALTRRRGDPIDNAVGRTSLRMGRITLSHGSGGRASQELVDEIFGPALASPALDERRDAGVFSLDDTPGGETLALTTDSYVVSPLFFPGGDIGRLAVNGTVNDLAVVGARSPRLSVPVILEEGFSMDELRAVVASIQEAAREAGATVVTGDTKVVERGYGDGLYVNTSGVGRVWTDLPLSLAAARPGDRVLVSGTVGDHGTAVTLARQRMKSHGDVESDTAPLHQLVERLLQDVGPSVRSLRDATRGGLASALNEIAERSGTGIALDAANVPIRPAVRAACEQMGVDPLHMANEGKVVAVVAPEAADGALAALQADRLGAEAAVVGEVLETPPGMVFVRAEQKSARASGHRVLDTRIGDPLPRIC